MGPGDGVVVCEWLRFILIKYFAKLSDTATDRKCQGLLLVFTLAFPHSASLQTTFHFLLLALNSVPVRKWPEPQLTGPSCVVNFHCCNLGSSLKSINAAKVVQSAILRHHQGAACCSGRRREANGHFSCPRQSWKISPSREKFVWPGQGIAAKLWPMFGEGFSIFFLVAIFRLVAISSDDIGYQVHSFISVAVVLNFTINSRPDCSLHPGI